jgi:hypothetical protein
MPGREIGRRGGVFLPWILRPQKSMPNCSAGYTRLAEILTRSGGLGTSRPEVDIALSTAWRRLCNAIENISMKLKNLQWRCKSLTALTRRYTIKYYHVQGTVKRILSVRASNNA